MDNLNTNQSSQNLTRMLCHHAKVGANIIRDFSNPFALDGWLELTEGEDGEEEKKVQVDIIHTKVDKSTKSQHLAVVCIKNKISLLYTTGKQITPTCSSCSSVNCNCVRAWKSFCKEQEVKEHNHDKDVDGDNDDKGDKDDIPSEPAHYLRKDDQYGYNETRIMFPLYSCPQQKRIIDQKQAGTFSLPPVLIPKYDPLKVCKLHKNKFKEDDDFLKLSAEYTIVYHERGETVYDTKVYYRETEGTCNCRDNYDGHEFLLFHMGSGKMVDYIALTSYVILMCNGGVTAYAYHKTILDNCKAMGSNFTCSYKTFLEASDGFVINLVFDEADCFTCTNCGIAPKYFVGDGKANIAPLQRKLKPLNIKELSSHPEDSSILPQGSKHEERVFLSIKQERDSICQLLTEKQTVEEFLSSSNLKSEHGKLIKQVIDRLSKKSSETLPEPYILFLADVSKNTPVAGLIQVTSKKSLLLLRQFCVRQLDVRNGNHSQELYILNSELPSLWPQLINICEHEESNFLPHDVSKIVLGLLTVRKNTFRNAPQRFSEDYIKYENEFNEDPTQYYPMHKLLTFPKLYNVTRKNDEDFCEKKFPSHHDFADGIFSIGCACELSITYGFELMLGHESPRHFFKFLMNRKVNFKKLEGVIFDFACGLQRYALNREPENFEFVRFLVDGCHFQGQKKLKRPDSRSGKSGHLGCSTGYNWSLYKQYSKVSEDGARGNSQGREQMHSILDKLGRSLRQKNYSNFMHYMRVFFCIRNLMIMKKL